MRAVLRLLRPYQWSKNLLVFTSLLLAHQYGDPALLRDTLVCFVAFCCVASAGYVFNDWLDMADDREHPEKRLRPLAAGEVAPGVAAALALLLLVSGLFLASRLNTWVLLTALAYLLSTLLYSAWLKSKLLLDVVMLAVLYTLRIIAGVAVMAIEPSFWLLAFAMFIFFSLATLKRFVELQDRQRAGHAESAARAWREEDLPMVAVLGLGSGLIAVLVLAFYIDSEIVRASYTHPYTLWLLCPVFLYWVGRVWLLGNRGRVHGDPILFALGDRLSYLVALAALCIIILAR